jgi:hypothetical protein
MHTYRPTAGWKFTFIAMATTARYWRTVADRVAGQRVDRVGTFPRIDWTRRGILLVLVRLRVVLRHDSMTIHDWKRTRTVSKCELQGWRSVPTDSNERLALVLRADGTEAVLDDWFYELDEAFWAWLVDVPNLDSVPARPVPRPLPEVPPIVKAANWAGLLLMWWGIFYPKPYPLVAGVMIAAPWLAIAAVAQSGGNLRLSGPFIMPALGLLAVALNSVQLLRWSEAAGAAVILALALFAAMLMADQSLRHRGGYLFGILIFTMLYGLGASVGLDVLLDRSQPVEYRAAVVGKRILRGRSMRFQVQLEPWGPITVSKEVTVMPAFYKTLQPGLPVCISLHHGAIGIRWFSVEACSATLP